MCGSGGGVGGRPACGGPLVTDLQRGEVVCAQCGLVVAELTVDVGPEWHVFDERERRRVRSAPLKLVVKTDMAVRPEHGARWRRLAKLSVSFAFVRPEARGGREGRRNLRAYSRRMRRR